ncbi:MAG: diacylglycerol kinase (ATP) [Saprospiraceae bacterium]|jgi:diacylglycerol kinase (ATP)
MLRKRIESFRFAFAGIAHFVKSEPNVIIHLIAAAIAVGMGFFFAITTIEWCLVIFAIGLVLSAEAFNTSIEYLTDLVSPDYHELAGKTKDVAAAAVLLTAIAAATVGLLIFLPKILAWLHLLN